MKILIISQYFWPENFKINDFASALIERGHDITILTGKPNYPQGKFYKDYGLFTKRKEYFNKMKIIRSPIIPRGKGSGIRLLCNYISFAFFASFTGLFRVKGNYDIIFVFEPSPITVGIPAIFLRWLKKAPIFFWVQDLWPESISAAGNINSKTILSIINKLVKFIYKKSDKILISSEYFRNSIKEKKVDNSKIIHFPNWAEDVYLKPFDKDKYSEKIPMGFKIMFAGNIGDAQDFVSLIKTAEILKKYKNIHWLILGDGRKKSWLEEQIKEKCLSENFHLLGRYPIEEMPVFFNHADVMIVSLKKENIFALTVPAKVQTYMACKKPILAMLDGEGARIIEDAKAGLSCESGNYKKLAENILQLFELSKVDLENMGINSKKYYDQNFDRNLLLDKFEKIVATHKENE